MERKFVWALVIVLTVLSASVFVVYSVSPQPFLLSPEGRVRVALQFTGGGTATWNATGPRVFDGTFSARLNAGTVAGDGGGIFIGPLSFPLSVLTSDHVRFWAYHYNNATFHPRVNIVLDNGRTLEGKDSTTVDPGATVKCETPSTPPANCQGYPSADLWVQMEPKDSFFTSFGSVDPALSGVSGCTSSSPCTLSFWQSKFQTAKVIQIQIVYAHTGTGVGTGQIIFIDDLTIMAPPLFASLLVPIEPETVSSSDR